MKGLRHMQLLCRYALFLGGTVWLGALAQPVEASAPVPELVKKAGAALAAAPSARTAGTAIMSSEDVRVTSSPASTGGATLPSLSAEKPKNLDESHAPASPSAEKSVPSSEEKPADADKAAGATKSENEPGSSSKESAGAGQEVLPVGDDALPTKYEQTNNPYLESDKAGDMSGAYVPPSAKKVEERSPESNELRTVLGEDVYNRRVNITTPPDTDVAEVIRLLAERASLNFIYGEGVIKGRVTLNLKDVPLGVALQSLLATHGLQLVREGENVIRIVSRQSSTGKQIETRTISIKLNWVQAETMVRTLGNFAGQGTNSTLRAAEESNTLIITDTPQNIAVLRDIVAQLDVPEKQVMIEARMAEIIIDRSRQLGSKTTVERLDGSGRSPGVGTIGGNAGLPVKDLVQNLLVDNPNAGKIDFGGVVTIFGKKFDVAATLNGLEAQRVANVLANPRIITLNNQEATIDINREIPYTDAVNTAGGATVEQVKFKDAGVTLHVTPNITNNGFVRLRMIPEQRIFSGFDQITGRVPVIDRRQAITNVIVKDEDTVVLGGLREIDSGLTKQSFPWLGQVPIIGWFFKKETKLNLKNDLMLFVTPHIVKAPVMAPAENYKWNRIDAHWDLPDFFFEDSVEQREKRHRGEADWSVKARSPETLKLPPIEPSAVEKTVEPKTTTTNGESGSK